MCAINGIYKLKHREKTSAQAILERMNNVVIHRGPDDVGFFISENNNEYIVGMAHRRLSIIDLQNGSQPIFSHDKQKVIVYNGEVYNYQELKEKYFTQEDVFSTTTDTEVVLKLYEKYGVHAFGMLEGMFAFSIYDTDKQKLFIARDFFGEKPLYYTQQEDGLYWASELKSIITALPEKPEIDCMGLNLFFRLSYIPAPYTIYSDIHKLEANHYLELDCLSGDIFINPIKSESTKFEISGFEEAKKLTRQMVSNSVASRLISDVPVGAFLSGGVDSSIVSLCAARQLSTPLDTFSIGFEKRSFNETEKSQVVAKLIGSHHHEFIVKEQDIFDSVEKVILNFDEPFADSSALPSYMVALNTSKHATVALTGDGGDEVFGGYNKYYMGSLNRTYTVWVPQPLHKGILKLSKSLLNVKEDNRGMKFKLNRLLKGIDYNNDYYYNIVSLGFMENESESLLNASFYEKDPLFVYKQKIKNTSNSLHSFREIDRLLSLEGDSCVKVDRTAMLASIETRAPFLNKELWNLASQLPENYLMKGMNKKYILKKAFEKEFPKGFLDKSKKGFGVPVGDWLSGSLKDELTKYIDKDLLKKQDIFNPEYIIPLVQNHIQGISDNTFRVWAFFCFQKWYSVTYDK